MILPNNATIAVLDGKNMRLFRNAGHEPHIVLESLPVPDLGVDNAGSGARHRSSTANPDRRRLEEDDFAAAATGYLNREALAGRIDKIVLAADPRTLGEIRAHLHSALVDKVIAQIPSDLTGHQQESIAKAIMEA